MNERQQDCELLRAFVRRGDQAAFASVVRRHLDLVYATALRKLEDPGAAEEVAQNVFAAPAGWQWHQVQLARKDAAATQLTVEAARAQQEELASETARLRAQSTRLDGALARATEAQARSQDSVRQEDPLKARLFGLLTAADYHWPEDLDFVRIPKSAVKELKPILAVGVTGKIRDWGAELLGLTPEEKQRAEAALQAHAQAVSQLAASQAYETNSLPASMATHWAGKPYKSIWVPPLGADAQSLMAGLLAQVGDALGEERAQLLLGDDAAGKGGYSPWGSAVSGLSRGTLFTVCVNPDQPDGLEYGQYVDANGGNGHSQDRHAVTLSRLPEAISSQFFDPWLAQMGITNTATRANP